jgi:hypothetical protein
MDGLTVAQGVLETADLDTVMRMSKLKSFV